MHDNGVEYYNENETVENRDAPRHEKMRICVSFSLYMSGCLLLYCVIFNLSLYAHYYNA